MWYNKEWWKPISKTLSFACNESELLEVLIGSIGVVPDGYFVTENETAEMLSKQVIIEKQSVVYTTYTT